MSEEVEVIDGTGHILGRLASVVAKELLKGKRITIVNAEKVIISGSKERVFSDYKEKRDRGSREKGPYFPKMPDRIVRRTIRGMLPYKKEKGREALSRLQVYISIPKEYEKVEKRRIEEADGKRLSSFRYVTLEEVSKKLGWVPR
ncbi:MAG: 50S ribosomal protein L13 [Candidatus Methanospirareceae archaeon]